MAIVIAIVWHIILSRARPGWQMAADGIRVREDGTRLSTSIAVRPTNVDLFTFATAAIASRNRGSFQDNPRTAGGDALKATNCF